jgi:hypothetical protein
MSLAALIAWISIIALAFALTLDEPRKTNEKNNS